MTHSELCVRAGQWLKSRRRCVAVTTRVDERGLLPEVP